MHEEQMCAFVEAVVHHVVWSRGLYPDGIFAQRLAFGVPIKASQHPGLNDYIGQSLEAFKACSNHAQGLDLLVLNKEGIVVETYSFRMTSEHSEEDIKEELRTCLLKVSSRLSELDPLFCPADHSFSFRIHTSDDGAAIVSDKDLDWCAAADPKSDIDSSTTAVIVPVHKVASFKFFIQLQSK